MLAQEKTGKSKHLLTILLEAGGLQPWAGGPGLRRQLMLAGRVVGQMDLKRRFEEKLQEAGRDLEVVIRGHRDVPYRYVEPIMLSCVRAGIWNVTFAVYRPGDHR